MINIFREILRCMAFCCFFDCPVDAQSTSIPEMIWVRGGQFCLGDSTGNADEKPLHKVLLSDFYLAQTEITLLQFSTFVAKTRYKTAAEQGNGSFIWDSLGWTIHEGINWRHDESGRKFREHGLDRPVVHVTWQDAAEYCNWLSGQQGLKKVFEIRSDTVLIDLEADGYRLPTEAEWECAAAGGVGVTKPLFSGGNTIENLAWYSGNAQKRAQPVARKTPNPLGFYDLTGNVWEWCLDRYSPDFYKRSVGANNPVLLVGNQGVVLRGGSWHNNLSHCRITNRTSRYPDQRDGSIGFRVARRKK